jgi:predicted HTH domain antitoxin
MRVLEIPYSEDLLIASGQEPQELEQELRFLLASKLFELRRLSLGKASEVAGIACSSWTSSAAGRFL